MSVPYIFVILIFISNNFTSYVYGFDLKGNFVHGKLYPILHFYGIIYLLIMFADVFSQKKIQKKAVFYCM